MEYPLVGLDSPRHEMLQEAVPEAKIDKLHAVPWFSWRLFLQMDWTTRRFAVVLGSQNVMRPGVSRPLESEILCEAVGCAPALHKLQQ